jgi:hypothetical protein
MNCTRTFQYCVILALAAMLSACAMSSARPVSPISLTGQTGSASIPSAIPVPPTPQAFPVTPTVTATREGSAISGSEYGIQLIGVTKSSEPVFLGIKNNSLQHLNPSANHVFLKVTLDFYQHGERLAGDLDSEPAKVAVVDSTGESYASETIYNQVLADDGTFHPAILYFDVPEKSFGFKLRYRDLTLIDLGL